MATTLKVINELFDETIEKITNNSENWQSFLKTASMNYKYSFSDQLLIYAQRPNSTACADYDTWNNVFGRYVKGEGIALLTEYDGRPKLRYVWDIKNTHIKYRSNGKKIDLWKIEKNYEEKVINSLKNKYSNLQLENSFSDVIKSISNNLVLNNYYNYFNELILNKNDMKLKHLNDEVIERKFKELLENSVAYMIINRCGINPASYFDNSDFIEIVIFDDVDNISRLGIAISDIAEIGINEIYTVLNDIKKEEKEKIYTLDKKDNLVYDDNEKKNDIERRDNNEYSIHENKRFETTESNSEREERKQSREIFDDEVAVFEGAQANGLSNDVDERHIDRTLGGNREDITREITSDNESNDDRFEYQREIESNQSNGMGGNDEQHQTLSRRNDIERVNLQLEKQENTDSGIPFSLEEYSYKIGDKVFIGETEFEITKIGIFDITLHDINFPLLSRVMNIVEFETKIKENPANDYLKKRQIEKTNQINNKLEYLILTEIEDLNDENSYTVARVINDNECVELHYSNGMAYIEIGTKNDDNSWDSIIESAEWFNKNLSNDEVLDKLEEIFKENFDDTPIISFEEKDYTKEIDFLEKILSIHKVNDIIINYDEDGNLIANDEDNNVWVGKEFYDFLFNELFVYNSDNKVDLISESDFERLNNYYNKYKSEEELLIKEDIKQAKKVLSLFELKEQSNKSKPPITNTSSQLSLFKSKEQELADKLLDIFNSLDTKYKDSLYIREIELKKWDHISSKKKNLSIIIKSQNYDEFGDNSFTQFNRDKTDEKTIINEIQNNEFIKILNKDDDFSITLTPTSIIIYYHNFEDKVINYNIEETNNEIIVEDTNNDEIELVENNIPKKEIIQNKDNYVLHPEIPFEERINYKITNDDIGVATPKERYKNNIEAIKVLKKCELENRYATKEEQDILANYVGWGGLSQAFDKDNASWQKEYNELKELLTKEEYNSSMESTLTAFYTPPVVIRSMYKALSNMGLDKGNILEPSCGVGNFIGMLPNNDKLKIYGVEIDPISGSITRQLYQKSSIAITGFEKTNFSDSFFDVAIGNVPFGDFPVNDSKYNKHNFLIHDYFFAKTLDKVRPGGIVAFITSKGTLDKENSNVRRYLSQRADLIGAIRLPNDTFKKSAGTIITSDILFFQKRSAITDIEPSWVKLGVNKDGIRMNNYFIEHPEMILGEIKIDDYRGDTMCVPFEDNNLERLLDNAISNIKAEIKDYERDENEEETSSIEADMNVKNFSYTVINDKVYYRENSRMYLQDLPSATENRIKGLIEIRDCVRTLINYQVEDYSDEDIKEQQHKLNNLYDKFTKKYGLINSRGNSTAFSNDNSYFLLCSLEVLDADGNLLRKADMFTKRTIKPHSKIDKVNNAIDARILSLTEKAKIDLDYMSEISNISIDKLIEDLKGDIFKDPITEEWQTSEEYLSGDVREKLEIAEEYAKENSDYEINVEYLKQVIPKDIATSEISVRLGATWIPSSDYQDFMFELLEPSYFAKQKMKVHLSEINGEWTIEGKGYDRYGVKVNSTYGTKRANAYRLFEDALNLRDTKIFDYEVNEEGKKEAILNKKETAIAQAKQDIIKNKFSEWIWSDPDRRERLTNLYNRKFNAIRPREYDGSFMVFQGINPEIKLRTHQINSIAMMVYGGNTLLAQEVGAGKTFSMIAAAMESKRLGLCNKSLFVVPNHIIEQFASEFLELYPSANILVSTKKDFETKNRKKFCSRIATGDYDAIIIGHSQFEKIPMSVKRQEAILNRQLDDILKGIEELKKNNGEKITIKQLMRSKKSVESKLEKLNNQKRKDDVITFEELGVDKLFVDEAHYYKNLYFHTKMRNVGGIAQTEAQKTMDLFMKTQYLDELTGNKGVVLATGTPISNSMVELYTFQRYLQYDTLVKYNLQHFDSWASTFGETITALEIAPEGTGFRAKTRFSRFYNLPELMAMFKQVADIKTADMLDLPVPEMEDIKVLVEPSEIQLDIMNSFVERAELIREGKVDPSQDNMLKITNEGRKLAIDPRLLDKTLPEHKEGKINKSAECIHKIWEDTKEKRLTQMVFCDIGTPNSEERFNVYDELKKKLIEKGVDESDIEFIHNAKNDSQKKEIFSKVRRGDIRILIGSTSRMGAGTNCQDLLIAEHNLDCPWRPSDLKQRRGRIERQGNKNKKAYVYSYLGKKTHDGFSYGKLEAKQKALSQVMTSKSPLRSMEDVDETTISYAEMKALASDNPLMMEKIELEAQVSKLKLLKQSHLSQIYEMEDKIRKEYPAQIKNLERMIDGYKADIEHLKVNTHLNEDGFSPMTINDKEYKDKKEAGIALTEQILNHPSKEPKLIGEYRGFKLESWYDSFFKQHKLDIVNNQEYTIELGNSASGNLIRIDNLLESLSEKLEEKINILSDVKKQLEVAKEEVKRPFNQEHELKDKSKRLDEVDILLDLNEKTNIIIDEKDDSVEKENQIYKEEYAR